jgi:hypothetical protein
VEPFRAIVIRAPELPAILLIGRFREICTAATSGYAVRMLNLVIMFRTLWRTMSTEVLTMLLVAAIAGLLGALWG